MVSMTLTPSFLRMRLDEDLDRVGVAVEIPGREMLDQFGAAR